MSWFKTTIGWVSQEFGDDGKCISQQFVCGDQCDYEDDKGESIDNPPNEVYQPYDMRQPVSKAEVDAVIEGAEKQAALVEALLAAYKVAQRAGRFNGLELPVKYWILLNKIDAREDS